MDFGFSPSPPEVAAYQAVVAKRCRISAAREKNQAALARNSAERKRLLAESARIEREAAAIGMNRLRGRRQKADDKRELLLGLWEASPEKQNGGTQRDFAKRMFAAEGPKRGNSWEAIERQLSIVKHGRRKASKGVYRTVLEEI